MSPPRLHNAPYFLAAAKCAIIYQHTFLPGHDEAAVAAVDEPGYAQSDGREHEVVEVWGGVLKRERVRVGQVRGYEKEEFGGDGEEVGWGRGGEGHGG